ncbi:LapA family protein [Ancylothrix sp. C2]|uniref:LapA family protein n=1 Tax=Ancylothrix sp. D3o TaxID=2953691 RepID=UPI0021BB8D63|nr:LapA family protein [Ancylothrix sp. D3o]MCT7952143.1 LapA family protein [Ancylothrix sp. D3o]
MREIRNVLLFVLLGSLTIFAVQNSSTFALPLVFLGMASLTLPLSVWVLGAFFAGVVTALIIGALFKFSHPLINQESASNRRIPSRQNDIPPRQPAPRTDTVLQDNYDRPERVYSETITGGAVGWREEKDDDLQDNLRGRANEQTRPRNEDTARRNNYSEPDIDDDEFYEDWEEETPENRNLENKNYEASQEPKSTSWTGSVYSYSYRESAESEPPKIELIPDKKTEPVTDADYRVIIPPPAPTPPPPVEDDWGKKKKPKSDDW